MSRRMRIVLIIVILAVVAYFAYRWWTNRSASPAGNAGDTGLGANLNSIAPELVAGSTGPESGLNYTQGAETVNINLPSGEQTQTNPPPPVLPQPTTKPPFRVFRPIPQPVKQ